MAFPTHINQPRITSWNMQILLYLITRERDVPQSVKPAPALRTNAVWPAVLAHWWIATTRDAGARAAHLGLVLHCPKVSHNCEVILRYGLGNILGLNITDLVESNMLGENTPEDRLTLAAQPRGQHCVSGSNP